MPMFVFCFPIIASVSSAFGFVSISFPRILLILAKLVNQATEKSFFNCKTENTILLT
jgi:hypothetical protein